MATVYRLLDVAAQYFNDNGDPYAGGKLFTYTAGSSTKKTTYQESTGTTAHANPIVLDAGGRLPAPVFGTTGAYKFVLAPSTDTDPPTSAEWTEDGISGINDTATASVDQWVASGLTPTYVGATSFTLTGDQRTEFHVGRRLKSTNSGGTIYSRITASAFGALTTVTVVNDSGVLDAGLSAVSYGLLTTTNPAIPYLPANVGGACALLETETASTSATLDFTLDLTNYGRHVIYFDNLKPVTDGVELWGRLSSDGVTYATSAYRWARHNLTDAASEGLAGSTSDAKFLMANAVGNVDGEQVSGTVEITSVTGMGVRVAWRLSGENAAGAYYMINGIGAYVAAASTYFRLLFSSGNLAAGTARMYAFKV